MFTTKQVALFISSGKNVVPYILLYLHIGFLVFSLKNKIIIYKLLSLFRRPPIIRRRVIRRRIIRRRVIRRRIIRRWIIVGYHLSYSSLYVGVLSIGAGGMLIL